MNLKEATILAIDDDTDVLTAVRFLLKTEVKEIITEKNPENIRSLFPQKNFDLVLLDMNFNSSINTGNEGFFWLRKIKELSPATPVIMITAYGDIDLAVRALKEGAADFVVKPWHNEKLTDTIREALLQKAKSSSPKNTVADFSTSTEMLGESEPMLDIFRKIEKIAPTDANILILGENGTGKDLLAKAIHRHSGRSRQAFIKADLGSLTETLFESELFGYKKGAFTDAREDRMGRFEAANGGTLFLDEIGNISLQQQARLLTVLQNRQVTPLGTSVPVPVDIRLVCATNLPVTELANENRFRKDLVYRINTVEITIPPLRKRVNDIALLARHFTKLYAEKYFRTGTRISNQAIARLEEYHFPGNVRELQHTIERAVIMCETEEIMPSDLLFSPLEKNAGAETTDHDFRLSTVERNAILRVIEKHNGNITKAARDLGLTRTALYRRLSKYDI
jgi:two-component system response regulator HydG